MIGGPDPRVGVLGEWPGIQRWRSRADTMESVRGNLNRVAMRCLTSKQADDEMNRKIRGSGFKYTLPAVLPFSAIWFFVVVLAAPVITVAMMLGSVVPPSLHGDVWFFLFTRVPVIVLAVTALAIFTTTRVAGPFVPLKRAFEDVKHGDMDCRLRFRRADKHLQELEAAFNEMMVVVRERIDSRGGPETEE